MLSIVLIKQSLLANQSLPATPKSLMIHMFP